MAVKATLRCYGRKFRKSRTKRKSLKLPERKQNKTPNKTGHLQRNESPTSLRFPLRNV